MTNYDISCDNCGNILNYTICIDCEVVVPYCDKCGFAGMHQDHRLLVNEETRLTEEEEKRRKFYLNGCIL